VVCKTPPVPYARVASFVYKRNPNPSTAGGKALLRGLFRTKSLDDILAAAGGPQFSLKRTLGAFNITLLGIGAIIGAGIFATVGTAAAGDAQRPGAGPSLMLSFVITAVVCGFTALCYAEFASMVPISGSAYTYSYSTLGELVAWIIGWDLIIEYAVGNIAVAISWANYFRTLMANLGVDIPAWLATDYRTAASLAVSNPEKYATDFGGAPHLFGHAIVFNLLAAGIVTLITIVLVWGIKESAEFNAGMVIIKIIVLLFFIGMALYYVSPAKMSHNWVPFQPNGWHGTFTGAALVFFAYIGFDAVSTVAEECKNPSRDLPIGIIASLIICTILYVVVGAVFAGLMPYTELQQKLITEQAEPLTMALTHVAPAGVTWPSTIVAFGSVIAHTAVLLVFQLGQPRIFFSMARDGLLPPVFASVHPRFKTPHVTTILTGVFVGVFAAFASLDEVIDLTNIGTLFAFILVCVGIPILRFKDPGRERPFRVPGGALLFPLLGAVSCFFLMYYLPPASWWRFIGWLVLGFAIYVSYGYTRSSVGQKVGRPSKTPAPLKVAALGFLLVAAGLFTIPHDLGPRLLVEAATKAGADRHERAVYGLLLILVGLVTGIVGTVLGSQRGGAEPEAR
jgi:APA family basic amino acid/polyamine antiporter